MCGRSRENYENYKATPSPELSDGIQLLSQQSGQKFYQRNMTISDLNEFMKSRDKTSTIYHTSLPWSFGSYRENSMSGKPPIGKGNRRWNLNQSTNKSNEKKDILRAIDDIYNILDGREQQNEDIKAQKLSEILFRLSKISIPNKQTNLTKVTGRNQ